MCPDLGSSLGPAKSSPMTGVADVHLIQEPVHVQIAESTQELMCQWYSDMLSLAQGH